MNHDTRTLLPFSVINLRQTRCTLYMKALYVEIMFLFFPLSFISFLCSEFTSYHVESAYQWKDISWDAYIVTKFYRKWKNCNDYLVIKLSRLSHKKASAFLNNGVNLSEWVGWWGVCLKTLMYVSLGFSPLQLRQYRRPYWDIRPIWMTSIHCG